MSLTYSENGKVEGMGVFLMQDTRSEDSLVLGSQSFFFIMQTLTRSTTNSRSSLILFDPRSSLKEGLCSAATAHKLNREAELSEKKGQVKD